ncbi:MAG: GntR family transcriptional regulator [Planctomycetes bacterium]|nr:GntR family transcriptional regulator [Planctomycetota bacterium]
MLIEIDNHSGVPVYKQIMEQIRLAILYGHLEEEEQLPSVRDLASELQVNPMTISKSYAYLENEGLLMRKRGKGIYVSSSSQQIKEEEKIKILEESMSVMMAQASQLGVPKAELKLLFEKFCKSYKAE